MFDYINKTVKHSAVFSDCANFINGQNQSVLNLKCALRDASELFNKLEKGENENSQIKHYIEIYNSNYFKFINKEIERYNFSEPFNEKDYFYILNSTIRYINRLNGWRIYESSNYEFDRANKKQVFLSYSSLDKAYSFWLYHYFRQNGLFLYVDWMHGRYYLNGVNSKASLLNEITKSNQFLFLHTSSSYLQYYKNHLSEWCAWEIGASTAARKEQFEVMSYGASKAKSPSILDGFKNLVKIENYLMVDK